MSATLDPCIGLLEELGFRKRAGQVLTIELAPDVLGWLGLNTATRHQPTGTAEVNPVVGVRHQQVERLVAVHRGERAHAYRPPTIGTPIGHVMPERRYRAWTLSAAEQDDQGREMVAAIAEHGLGFMRDHLTLEAILDAIDRRLGVEQQLAYRRPVVLSLLGRADEAADDLRRQVDQLGDRDDAAAGELRAYAESFLSSCPT